jgi:NADH-quinone oxidoreductase subunit H
MYVGGWHGWAQSLADGIKLLLKEDIIPAAADPLLFKLAPIMVFVGAFAAFVVLPFGAASIVADLNIGVLYVLAVASLSVVGIIMGGWASNNKYALYGGMRSAAQIISYEIPAALALMTVVVQVGSLSMQDIVNAQQGGIHKWFIFRNPFTFVAFFIYFVCSLAEVNRTPFDIPEAESELVAGYHTEYSGMRFAFFMLAEYANMFVVAGIATTIFLGGWTQILPAELVPQLIPGPILFSLKALFLVFVQMWLRWSLPRLRVDQLMYLCWKVMLPISMVLILGVGFLAVYWK